MEDDDNLEAEVNLLLGRGSNSSSANSSDKNPGTKNRGPIRNLASRSAAASAQSLENEEVDLAGLLSQTDNLLKLYEKQRDSLKKR